MAEIDHRIALDQGGAAPINFADTIRLGQQIAQQRQIQQQEMMKQQGLAERQQQLQGLLGQGGTPQEMAGRLIGGGHLEEGMKLGKYGEDQATSKLNQQKQELGIIGEAASQLYSSPNYATGQAIVSNLRRMGINADQFESQLFEHRDNPKALQQIAAGYQMQIKDMLPKLGTLETGAAIQDRSINPVTNEIQVLGETPVQLTPGQIQQGQIAREGNQIQIRGQDLANARSLESNRVAAEKNTTPSLSKGQEALDKDFAKEYSDFVAQGGSADVNKSIEQLNIAAKNLAEDKTLTGPIAGQTPDAIRAITNPKAIATRESVEEIVQRNLRLILGAQFTQKEGDRLIARAYNPLLSTEENRKRVLRLGNQIQEAAKVKADAANYFEQNGTLQGWKGKMPTISDFNPESTGKSNNSFNLTSMPDPAKLSGKMVESDDGVRYRSNGTSWVKVK